MAPMWAVRMAMFSARITSRLRLPGARVGHEPRQLGQRLRNPDDRSTSRKACTGSRSSRSRRLRKSYSSSLKGANPRS